MQNKSDVPAWVFSDRVQKASLSPLPDLFDGLQGFQLTEFVHFVKNPMLQLKSGSGDLSGFKSPLAVRGIKGADAFIFQPTRQLVIEEVAN